MIGFTLEVSARSRQALVGLILVLTSDIATAQQQPTYETVPPAPGVVELPSQPPSRAQAATRNRTAELWADKPLGQLTASIATNLPEAEKLIESEAARLSQGAAVIARHGTIVSAMGDSRPWILANYEWEAPATRHLPLLFEEPNLERLGYTPHCLGCDMSPRVSRCLQPIISGAHFFGRVPLIPYQLGVDPACEPIYTLGVDRPGSPVPYRRHWIPLSLKGAIYQAGATVGVLYIFP